ncbi:MerR family transcriptional regulator [Streptomyces variegatus]|uniref:MerR family transcriptional regulator n=1 Tax=Streptomyces variegatus TaxID=284040 RepID=UPI003C2CEE9D
MKVSELSRRSGVPVGSIKFYLREGLLPAGRATAAKLAEYGEEHVQRLRLIRSLTTLGGLSIAATREVLAAIDEPQQLNTALKVMHYALPGPSCDKKNGAGQDGEGKTEVTAASEFSAEVDSLVDAMGWQVSDESPYRGALAASLEELQRLGVEYTATDLIPYARLTADAARLDLDQLDGIEEPMALAERAAIITVLFEPVLALLRRLSQEDELRRRAALPREGAGT